MSRDPDEDETGLDARTLRALRDADDLVPTSEAEVERAEAQLSDDLELPPSLQQYRSRGAQPDNVRALPSKRGSWLTHSAAVALGALAAAFALWWLRTPPAPPVTSAGGELVRPSSNAPPARMPIAFGSRCERQCCAGTQCAAASENLRACPSGMRCIGCAPDNAGGGPYRLRLGSMVPTEAGQKLLPLEAPLELCVPSPTTGESRCLPALGDDNGDTWRLLQQVTSIQELLTGLTVELRKRGDRAALASWKHPVSPTTEVLCKGLLIPLSDGTEVLARISAFVEHTHFVELSRAAAVPQLLTTLARFDISGIEPRIYETSRPEAGRFALTFGPLEKADADALRWQILDHGVEATVSHGLDFVGSARPTR
jgi:hypothetical protein